MIRPAGGPVDRRMWRREPGSALRVHRRALTGAGSVRTRPALLARAVVQAARGGAQVEPDGALVADFSAWAGIGEDVVRRRLQRLARVGWPWRPALLLGLAADDDPDRWLSFVADRFRWNAAASGRGFRRAAALVQDKQATAEVLQRADLPVPQSLLLRAGSAVSGVQPALDTHGLVFVKPLTGSGGRGAFLVGPDPHDVREYQTGNSVSVESFAESLARLDHLAQPRLVTRADLRAATGEHDVVTVRVVTRRVHGEVVPFSTVLELPLPESQTGRRSYEVLGVAGDRIGGPVRPAWVATGADDARMATPVPVGEEVPGLADVVDLGVRAHRCVPGLFAAAWDVALTDAGPVILEGNTGFATLVPQWHAGGLLGGLD